MKKFLLFNTIALFLCLFVVVVLSVPYLFSKISPYSSLGFFSVVEEDFKSNFNKNYYNELLKGEKINGTFTTSEDNIGIILVRFYNLGRINSDSVTFRLKEENQKKWYYEHSYKVDQFQPNQYFTFGFPQIPDSRNKKYLFEIESSAGKEGDAVAISKKNPTVAYVYQYSKAKIFEDKKTLLRFSIKKIKYALDNFDKKRLIVSYLLFLTAIIILFKKRIVIKISKRILLFVHRIFIKWRNLKKTISLKPFFAKIKKIIDNLYALYLSVKKSKLLRSITKFYRGTLMTEKNKRIFPFILLGMVVLFSLGKTLQYYFYTDDYSVLYHTQHNRPHGWPYNYLIVFAPFYRFFGLRAEAYSTLGILSFFLASLAIYWFIRTLTKNNLIALLSSLIFATGYIGVDQFTMMMVSLINNLNIINVSLTLILFILWLDTRKLRFYLLAMLMFWFSLKAFPARAFPLVLFLPTIEAILSFKLEHPLKILKKLALMTIRFLPFLLIAHNLGIFSYGSSTENKILSLLTPAFLKELFAILGRFVLLEPLVKFIGFFHLETPYTRIGFVFFSGIVLISLFLSLVKKRSRLERSLFIVLFLTIEGYIGNMLLLPSFDSGGTVNRYLTIAFLGYCAIFPILTYLLIGRLAKIIKKERLICLVPVLVLPLIITMALLSREYEQEIIRGRSLPARQFYKQLKSYLPSISGKNIFYFDHADYYPIASNFGSILLGAGMPKEVTLAVPYRVPIESIKIADNFDSLVDILAKKEVDINHIRTFYYDEEGLQQTTNKVLSILEKGERKEIFLDQASYGNEITNSWVEIPLLNISSLTSMVMNLTLKVSPLDSSYFYFPFYNIKTQDDGKKEQIKEFYSKLDKNLIFSYLSSRKEYYNNVKIEVTSFHLAYGGKFLTDDKGETSWLADECDWQVGIKPSIKIDLGKEKRISRLVLRQEKNRIPSDYEILTSEDEILWKQVKNISVSKALSDADLIINDFDPVVVRYFMLKINNTQNGSTPGLSEIELIEDKYRDVDISTALRIKENPLEFVQDEKELRETYGYLKQGGFLTLKTLTNKDEDISNSYSLRVPIILDGLYHEYKIPLSPRGTNLERIKFELNFPARIEIRKIEIIHPSLKELSQ